jgi:hypothetical protein
MTTPPASSVTAAAAAASPVPQAQPPHVHTAVEYAVAAAGASAAFALDKRTIAYACAGLLARVTGAILTSPLDTLKTRLQFEQRAAGVRQGLGAATAAAATVSPAAAAPGASTASAAAASAAAAGASDAKPVSTRAVPTLWRAARSIYSAEGISAFYRGLPIRLVYIGPASAVSFVFYEQFRHLYRMPEKERANTNKVTAPHLTSLAIARLHACTHCY